MTNRQKILQSSEYDLLRMFNEIYMTGSGCYGGCYNCLIEPFDRDFVQKNCNYIGNHACDRCIQKWLNSEYCGWKL